MFRSVRKVAQQKLEQEIWWVTVRFCEKLASSFVQMCFLWCRLTYTSQTRLCLHPPACIYNRVNPAACRRTNWSQPLEGFWFGCSVSTEDENQRKGRQHGRGIQTLTEELILLHSCQQTPTLFPKWGCCPTRRCWEPIWSLEHMSRKCGTPCSSNKI